MLESLPRFQKPRESTSLSERAYLVVRSQILKGELPLGASLSRRKLAKKLGMSLLPVAEALQRLESDGLVESRPRVGTRVYLPSAEDIREHYQVREALESQAARLFAEKSTQRERRELKKMADRMDEMFTQCLAEGSEVSREFLYEVHDHHARLHLRIAECTGCRALRRTLEKNHVLIFTWLYDVAAQRPPLPQHFHSDLIEAISKGDPEEADRAMRYHVRFGADNVVRGIFYHEQQKAV